MQIVLQGLNYFERLVLIMTCLVLQMIALAWYVLSYIPYGTAGALQGIKWLTSSCFRD